MPDGSLLEFAQLDHYSIDGDRERLHISYYAAPDLQKEREKSSLVWQELMEVVLGLEFVTMKREKGMLC